MTPRHVARIQGTGTAWDQTYYVTQITRRFSFDEGFTQTIELKNIKPIRTEAEL